MKVINPFTEINKEIDAIIERLKAGETVSTLDLLTLKITVLSFSISTEIDEIMNDKSSN